MSADELPAPFVDIDLPLADRREGKVRVSYRLDGDEPTRLFVTTDRLSAFDRIIAGIPYKGQVLNQLAAWWFARTTEHRRQPRHRRARPQRADRPGHDPAAGRGRRARGDHRRDVDVAVAALRRRVADDLRLPLPRRSAEEHAAARADRHPDDEAGRRLRRPRRAADVGRGRRARPRAGPSAGSSSRRSPSNCSPRASASPPTPG